MEAKVQHEERMEKCKEDWARSEEMKVVLLQREVQSLQDQVCFVENL